MTWYLKKRLQSEKKNGWYTDINLSLIIIHDVKYGPCKQYQSSLVSNAINLKYFDIVIGPF